MSWKSAEAHSTIIIHIKGCPEKVVEHSTRQSNTLDSRHGKRLTALDSVDIKEGDDGEKEGACAVDPPMNMISEMPDTGFLPVQSDVASVGKPPKSAYSVMQTKRIP
ncbi:uncharacterized protein BT62DRAFT_1007074 [Guyanagaster necrorhizus]|uniref:Uncharacterized protein n=1 Tax=Guyanagaster necrorhizus TaxID=856835 RepID=A0A9P8ARX1_9AGAR|nr:uncharacterized protein BT62DRAFT_1007074 [Guyanagaster necrorhizus MCA 3950]KAG7445356.1 hypothetical protein BT62DRAFT_1007074 [Guyanagaster necrorhizus MCA 3950]